MIRQAAAAFASVWLAATLAFVALRILPGDGITTQLRESGASEQMILERRATLGLEQPYLIQYTQFLVGLVRGDLGVSLLDGRPVSEIILQQLAPTAELAVTALVISTVGGITLGVFAALGWRASWLAKLILDLSLSVPLYWTGTLVIYVVALLATSLGTGGASGLALPALVLGFSGAGAVGQVAQANVSASLGEDFTRTARAKGMSERRVIIHHVLRASLIPVVSVIALQAGFLMGGVVITESLFVRPGIGRLLLNATMRQDYPVVQGIVVLSAVVYMLLNGVANILNRILDPRV